MPDTAPPAGVKAAPPARGPAEPALFDWLGLSACILMWSSAFAAIKYAVADLPAAVVVLVRLAIGAVILTAWALYRGRRFPAFTDRRWLWFAALGFFGNAMPFFLVATGQTVVESGLAGILMGATPLATLTLAHFLVPGERMNLLKVIGFAIGFSGIVVLMGPAALADLGGATFLAQLAIFAAGFGYAISTVLARLAPDTPPSLMAAGMLIGATLIAAPWGLWTLFTQDFEASARSIFAALWLGAAPTGLASLIYITVVRRAGPGFIAQSSYFLPVGAALIGVALGEALGWNAFLSLAIILTGVFIARLGARRRRP